MKIIITEKQADKLFGEKIKCKCGHSWVKEKGDKHYAKGCAAAKAGDKDTANKEHATKSCKGYDRGRYHQATTSQ
jgi:hypothetical protein